MALPTIDFPELTISDESQTKFDITEADIKSYQKKEQCSLMAAYNNLLLEKLANCGRLEKKEFILYQLESISAKKEWVFSFDKLIDSRVNSGNDLADAYWQMQLKGAQEILEDLIRKIDSSIPDSNTKKIQTTLSVPELGYLLKAFFDEGIITSKSKTELIRVYAGTFSSKKKTDVSEKSLKNSFDSPDPKAIDKMQEVFTHLMQRAKKDKEK